MAGTIGDIMRVQNGDPIDPQFGPGFIIQDDRGNLCLTVAYATATEADAAAEAIRNALAGQFGLSFRGNTTRRGHDSGIDRRGTRRANPIPAREGRGRSLSAAATDPRRPRQARPAIAAIRETATAEDHPAAVADAADLQGIDLRQRRSFNQGNLEGSVRSGSRTRILLLMVPFSET
jgi:hypothetical protein